MNNYFFSFSTDKKIELIRQNKHLDIFINDPSFIIRCAVLEQGYGIEQLVNDKSEYVRSKMAKLGYNLNTLISDESQTVRGWVIWYCEQHQEKEECRNIMELYKI